MIQILTSNRFLGSITMFRFLLLCGMETEGLVWGVRERLLSLE